jgi:hypothetical protein
MYLGIPITLKEGYQIFHIDYDLATDEILKKRHWGKDRFIDGHLIDYANNYFIKQSTNMRVFSTDKDQYIFGYEIKDTSNLINVDEFIVLIINKKAMFAQEIKLLNALECIPYII